MGAKELKRLEELDRRLAALADRYRELDTAFHLIRLERRKVDDQIQAAHQERQSLIQGQLVFGVA